MDGLKQHIRQLVANSIQTPQLRVGRHQTPDLALEIDITSRTHPNIYEALNVPGLWRFERDKLQINVLREGKYVESEQSPTFPGMPRAEVIPQYLEQSKTTGRNASLRHFGNG